MGKISTPTSHRETKLHALCALSGSSATLDPNATTVLIKESPDPETALRAVLAKIPTTSETLQRKWRKTVIDMWAPHHRHIPLLLELPLATSDVNDVPVLHDARAFLQELNKQPAEMSQEGKEWLLAPAAIYRLSSCLPSLYGQEIFHVEHELGYLTLRRLRAVLQLLRLVRRVKNKLYVVRSRYARFMSLPAIQQFYLLWHADTYHLDWADYAGIWGAYIRVVQEYVPLLWELNEEMPAMIPQDINQWCMRLWETYYPLWEQEGLLAKSTTGKETVLSLIQRHYLPAAFSTMLLHDLLGRYGLVLVEGEFFAWTDLGTTLLAAERSQEIPCGLELLS